MEEKELLKYFKGLFTELYNNSYSVEDLINIVKSFMENNKSLVPVSKVDAVICEREHVYDVQTKTREVNLYTRKEGESDTSEFRVRRSTEEESFTEIVYYPIKGEKFTKEQLEILDLATSVVYTFFSRMKYGEKLREAKYIDPSTGACNGVALQAFIQHIDTKQTSTQYFTVFSNLKDFKFLNQKLGPKTCDIVLRELVTRLKEQLTIDEIIVRPGGDNFISVVKKDKFQQYMNTLTNFEMELQGKKMKIQSSVGYYIINHDMPLNSAIENANIAMRVAKNSPLGDIIQFDEALKNEMIKRTTLKNEVLEGIKKEEFVSYYQPKVDSTEMELVGAESLARWVKNGKVVYPNTFIPIIEEFYADAFDYYMLKQVAKDMTEWKKKGLSPVKTSVNFSMQHIEDERTADKIVEVVDQFGLEHSLFEIELTELTAANEIDKVKRLIDKLHEYGFKVSMDDFGSGYSSLNALKFLNYDTIKIDKKLIDMIDKSDKKSLTILKNILAMLNELEITSLAEGVENLDQVEILAANGCDAIQGYYFDKPMPKEEFEEKLINRKY